MAGHPTSTGRGGAGNIGNDPNTYVDGEIVREGVAGDAKVDYLSGRGGAGNLNSPRLNAVPADKHEGSHDVIPETALRSNPHEDFHTGRGGAGNEHREKFAGHSKDHHDAAGAKPHESLLDKAKHALHLDKEKDKPTTPK